MFLAVDADHYLEASERVMDTLRTFPAVVQVLGWDEAFMAVETDDPEALARDVQRAVLERTDLWCSIGVGDSKHRAKLASAFAKPRGVFRLTREEWPALMGPKPVDALWGIGSEDRRQARTSSASTRSTSSRTPTTTCSRLGSVRTPDRGSVGSAPATTTARSAPSRTCVEGRATSGRSSRT